MVLNCVAYGCNNLHDKRKSISFHTFPFKRPQILELWITAVRRENWAPTKTSRLCGEHFLPCDYQLKPGSTSKILKPDAVPSIFSFPKHLVKAAPLPRRKLIKHVAPTLNKKNEVEHMDIDLPSTSTESKMFVDEGTQTNPDNTVTLLRRKVKTLKQKVKRRDLKLSTMKGVINEIRKSGHSNENLDAVLNNYFEGLPLELVLLQAKNKKAINPGQRRYTEVMRQFAHTLYFYSPKAYNFLRQHFVLPNGRTIRKWLSSVNFEPGILDNVLQFLKEEVKNKSYLKNCALIVDSMSIRKQVLWDNTQGKFTGNVNYGGIIDADFEMAASEALFFLIVSYTNNFKCPVAYYLINKTDANLQTQLIIACLRSLYDIGITIRSITSDGAQVNIATYTKLGCSIVAEKLIPFFPHPSETTIQVYCMLDICHMLKLARNAIAEKNINSHSGKISWEYVKALDRIQYAEQLKLANSLTSQHVNYKNKIMNVRLAAQTLSSGVADAIEYLDNCGVTEFKGSYATVEFIRHVDKIFDILNCRNPYGKGYKAPIRQNTLKYFDDVFLKTSEYLKTLFVDGIPLLHHNRKTFAVGFILTMKSTLGLVTDVFTLKENPLAYFLTYKCSQDHLEIFFACIRSRGGWNNNPNSQQLKWALRQLLFSNSVTSSISANCSNFGNYCTPAFEFRSQVRQKRDIVENNRELDQISTFIRYLEDKQLTDFQENVIFYISGYIVRNLLNRTTCNHCIEILLHKNNTLLDHSYSAAPESFKKFTNVITSGGLIYASDVVYKIVNFSERQFRLLVEKESLLKNQLNIKKLLINTAIHYFSVHIDMFTPKHPVTEEFLVEDSHEIQLVKKIIESAECITILNW